MKDQKPGARVGKKIGCCKRGGGGLEPKVRGNIFKICVKQRKPGEETNITQTYHRRGCGAELPTAGD